jgi:hypothetical protein
LYTLVYDHMISLNIDPIEKTALSFFARTPSYSVATVGCNRAGSAKTGDLAASEERQGSF